MTEHPSPDQVKDKNRPTIEELWRKSDTITQEIIAHPKRHPLAFAKMVWDGDYIPQSLQTCYDTLGKLRR